jgi:hypothetical protein
MMSFDWICSIFWIYGIELVQLADLPDWIQKATRSWLHKGVLCCYSVRSKIHKCDTGPVAASMPDNVAKQIQQMMFTRVLRQRLSYMISQRTPKFQDECWNKLPHAPVQHTEQCSTRNKMGNRSASSDERQGVSQSHTPPRHGEMADLKLVFKCLRQYDYFDVFAMLLKLELRLDMAIPKTPIRRFTSGEWAPTRRERRPLGKGESTPRY